MHVSVKLFKKNTCPWFRAFWFRGGLFGFILLSVIVGVSTGAPIQYEIAQVLLGFSVFISLFLLADRPLLNPVQAVVAIFYWWFGVGPTLIAAYKAILGFEEDALWAQVSGLESLWIVIFGLPLYAIIARIVLKEVSKINFGFKFLVPYGINYRMITLIIFLSVGALSKFIIFILHQYGISGKELVHYLGGTITNVWWVGIIDSMGQIFIFAKSAILSALVHSGKQITRKIKILGLILLIAIIWDAITSGWKGALIAPGIYLIVAYISQRQRIPWVWIGIGILAYLFVIEPFVSTGRHLAEKMDIRTTEERREIFQELLSDRSWLEDFSWQDIKIESPFRGIYMLAGEVTRRNSLFNGEWQGYTIIWGMSALIPRVIFPDKPMLNVGNFFALTVGVDLGIISPKDFITNIGVSLPFEIVGNFGWLAGIISFGIFGAFWVLICSLILSPIRLSHHPLTPMMVAFAMGWEQPIGHFLATLRGLIVPILITFFIWYWLNKRL